MDELLQRSLVRIHARRVGIVEVKRSGKDVIFLAAGISKNKWQQIIDKKIIPEVRGHCCCVSLFLVLSGYHS